MVWATVSSWSCFCWLYRAYPALAAKNIINLISVLTIWWCPCVEPSSCVVGRGCLLWPVHSLGKTLLAFVLLHSIHQGIICLLSQGVSWLPTFAFQSPIMKRTSLLGEWMLATIDLTEGIAHLIAKLWEMLRWFTLVIFTLGDYIKIIWKAYYNFTLRVSDSVGLGGFEGSVVRICFPSKNLHF